MTAPFLLTHSDALSTHNIHQPFYLLVAAVSGRVDKSGTVTWSLLRPCVVMTTNLLVQSSLSTAPTSTLMGSTSISVARSPLHERPNIAVQSEHLVKSQLRWQSVVLIHVHNDLSTKGTGTRRCQAELYAVMELLGIPVRIRRFYTSCIINFTSVWRY